MQLKSIPLEDGFRMPGEYELHSGCWMLWPERPDTWRLGAKPAQHAMVEIASTIARFEPVTIGVSYRQYLNARSVLPEDIRLVEISSNDCWMRDVGPTFVLNPAGVLRGVDWEFNGWGGMDAGIYFPWDQDALVARKVLEVERCDWYRPGIILEGGSIHVDGEGTLITTEECLLNPNRNPDLNKKEIERLLIQYLNVEKVIWLPRGVYRDETSGHVDNLCCFVHPGAIVLTWTEDRSDPQYPISQEAFELLSQERDARGRRFEITKVHQPGPLEITTEESLGIDFVEGTKLRKAGDRLPGSYINFYIANGGVVVPTFNDPWDQPALQVLHNLFPDRKVVGIPSREILLGGGNIHCITLQQPSR